MAALNIKNEEAVRLAKELAALEGESMTTVIVEALREKLERDRVPQIDHERVAYFLDLGRRVREAADPDWLERDIVGDVYDEDALPK